jgi:cobalt-zinc-cadmium resistance protein CzcA
VSVSVPRRRPSLPKENPLKPDDAREKRRDLITVTAFVPLFTMQGVEGQIFGSMARTYGCALFGALLATFTITAVLSSLLLPQQIREIETVFVRGLRNAYTPALSWALRSVRLAVLIGIAFLCVSRLAASRLGSELLPALDAGRTSGRS